MDIQGAPQLSITSAAHVSCISNEVSTVRPLPGKLGHKDAYYGQPKEKK